MARTLDMSVPTSPFLDANLGDISPAWRAFLTVLLARTGGTRGTQGDAWVLPLQQETSARVTADNALSVELAVEIQAREAGDAGNVSSGTVAGGDLAGTYPNPTLAPGVVCGYWMHCDLRSLPTSDPGGGLPWLDGNHVAVGTPTVALVGIGLEDGTGDWITEDGTGRWIWG